MKNSSVAYLLWCFGLIGLCGLHRFYLGSPITGILWFCTLGLLWIGQLIDLILIPGLTAEWNSKHANAAPTTIVVQNTVASPPPQQVVMSPPTTTTVVVQ
jgi:TM2 domain-containing membrane protein YozV